MRPPSLKLTIPNVFESSCPLPNRIELEFDSISDSTCISHSALLLLASPRLTVSSVWNQTRIWIERIRFWIVIGSLIEFQSNSHWEWNRIRIELHVASSRPVWIRLRLKWGRNSPSALYGNEFPSKSLWRQDPCLVGRDSLSFLLG